MHFKIVPPIGARYWAGMAIASICGANLGDATVDLLYLGDIARLAALGLAFAVVVLADQWSGRGNELHYWLAVLIVRAAATSLADIGVDYAQASYVTLSVGTAAILGTLLALRNAFIPKRGSMQPSYADGSYWGVMLLAGTLGTIIGDGIGHAIHPVTVGVPISAMTTGVAAAFILGARRRREASLGTATYWLGIVAIRAFGTNLGDISAYLLSLPLSIAISALLLATTLTLWTGPINPKVAEARRGHSSL